MVPYQNEPQANTSGHEGASSADGPKQSKGSSGDLVVGDLAKAADKFSELVRTIVSENDFLPVAGVIDERMRELAHFRRERSAM
jgi:hypothetical protein